jgi:hypothetical protein
MRRSLRTSRPRSIGTRYSNRNSISVSWPQIGLSYYILVVDCYGKCDSAIVPQPLSVALCPTLCSRRDRRGGRSAAELGGTGKKGIHVKSRNQQEKMPQIWDRQCRGARLKCDGFASAASKQAQREEGSRQQLRTRFRKLQSSLAAWLRHTSEAGEYWADHKSPSSVILAPRPAFARR